jgi:hypothetical protein
MGLDMYLYATKTIDDGTTVDAINKLLVGIDHWDEAEDAGQTLHYYVSMYDHSNPLEKLVGEQIAESAGLLPFKGDESNSLEVDVYPNDTVRVRFTVAYWRKANAIHGWFVDNCQDGVDECQISEDIPGEQLAHLIHLCSEALSSDHPEHILEPTQGFFFGGYDIDEWYRQDLQNTIDQLTPILKQAATAGGNVSFNYHSSW